LPLPRQPLRSLLPLRRDTGTILPCFRWYQERESLGKSMCAIFSRGWQPPARADSLTLVLSKRRFALLLCQLLFEKRSQLPPNISPTRSGGKAIFFYYLSFAKAFQKFENRGLTAGQDLRNREFLDPHENRQARVFFSALRSRP